MVGAWVDAGRVDVMVDDVLWSCAFPDAAIAWRPK